MHALLRPMFLLPLLLPALAATAQHIHIPERAAKPTAARQLEAPPAAMAKDSTPPLPINYVSSLQSYQNYAEEKIRPWKESNDQVKDAGGWREYAREAAQPDKASPPHKHGVRQ